MRELLLAIGGAFASNDCWKAAVTEWSDALARYEVPSFSMKAFLSCAEQFQKWAGRPQLAESFIRELIGIQTRHLVPVAGSTFKDAYNAYQRPGLEETRERRQAHDIGFEHCLISVAENIPPQEPVHIVLSKTPKWVGRPQRIYQKIRSTHPLAARFESYSAELTRDYAELQIADLVVSGFTRGQALQRPQPAWLHEYFVYLLTEHRKMCQAFSIGVVRRWRSCLADEPDSE